MIQRILPFVGAVAGAVLLAGAGTAGAQSPDACRDVLISQLADTTVQQADQNASLAAAHARCAQGTQNSKNASGGNVGIGYEGFDLKVGGQQSGGSGSANSDCGNDSTDQHFHAALYYAQSVHHDMVDAWKSCMLNRQSMACWSNPTGNGRHVTVHIDWNYFSKQPQVVTSTLSVGDAPSGPAFAQGQTLMLQGNLFNFDRNEDQEAKFTLQASPDGVSSQTCEVFIPPKETVVVHGDVVRVPREITLQWLDQPSVGSMPPLGLCRCVSISGPPRPQPLTQNLLGPHSPYPANSILRITNNCGREIQDYEVLDRNPQNVNPNPLAPAGGRTFGLSSVQDGQTLLVDVSGGVVGMTVMGNCPAAQFVGMPPMQPQMMPPGAGPGPGGGFTPLPPGQCPPFNPNCNLAPR
jgi:hypothetical protein